MDRCPSPERLRAFVLREAEGDTELIVGTLEGDLASQHAVESELAREGLDRTVMGREAFVERPKALRRRDRHGLGNDHRFDGR